MSKNRKFINFISIIILFLLTFINIFLYLKIENLENKLMKIEKEVKQLSNHLLSIE